MRLFLQKNDLSNLLVPEKKKMGGMQNPFEMLFGQKAEQEEPDYAEVAEVKRKRSDIATSLKAGELEEQMVTVEVSAQQPSMFDALQGSGMEQMGANMQDALSSLMPKKTVETKDESERCSNRT